MKQQLRTITKRLGAVLSRLVQRRVTEEFREFGQTGREPQSEAGKAFLAQIRAFERMANESIGGANYDAAVEEYERAQAAFNRAITRSHA